MPRLMIEQLLFHSTTFQAIEGRVGGRAVVRGRFNNEGGDKKFTIFVVERNGSEVAISTSDSLEEAEIRLSAHNQDGLTWSLARQ